MTLRRCCVWLLCVLLLAACRQSVRAPADPSVGPPQAATQTPLFTSEPTFTPQPTVPLPPTETPTPTPTETASPTETVAPTATSSSTPTPQPQVRLERGRWLQAIGDCAAARREFAEVVAAAAAGGQSASLRDQDVSEARYRLAQCYLRDEGLR